MILVPKACCLSRHTYIHLPTLTTNYSFFCDEKRIDHQLLYVSEMCMYFGTEGICCCLLQFFRESWTYEIDEATGIQMCLEYRCSYKVMCLEYWCSRAHFGSGHDMLIYPRSILWLVWPTKRKFYILVAPMLFKIGSCRWILRFL